MKENKTNFEDSLARLEEITSMLESGEFKLDESLALFEEGASLVKTCNQLLDQAEQKIKILLIKDGEIIKEDFYPEDNHE